MDLALRLIDFPAPRTISFQDTVSTVYSDHRVLSSNNVKKTASLIEKQYVAAMSNFLFQSFSQGDTTANLVPKQTTLLQCKPGMNMAVGFPRQQAIS